MDAMVSSSLLKSVRYHDNQHLVDIKAGRRQSCELQLSHIEGATVPDRINDLSLYQVMLLIFSMCDYYGDKGSCACDYFLNLTCGVKIRRQSLRHSDRRSLVNIHILTHTQTMFTVQRGVIINIGTSSLG